MHDSPSGPALLALARTVLLNDLMPLLPADRRLAALLVGNCMAIAEREASAAAEAAQAIDRELRMFYGDRHCAPDEHGDDWRRFAGDLRRGAFESMEPCEQRSRAILWRLTILLLRQANPRFLMANGLA